MVQCLGKITPLLQSSDETLAAMPLTHISLFTMVAKAMAKAMARLAKKFN